MTQRTPVIQSQPTQSEVVSNVSPNKRDPKTVLFVFFGLIVVTGAVYAGMQMGRKQVKVDAEPSFLAVTPQPTEISTSAEIANWKTYTNQKFNFSLKYPANWSYKEGSYKEGTNIVNEINFDVESSNLLKRPIGEMGSGASTPMVIKISKTDPNPLWQQQYFNNYESETYKIGEVNAVKISGTNKEANVYEMIVIARNNDLFYSFLAYGGMGEPNELFDQILSTFRFTGDTLLVSCDSDSQCSSGLFCDISYPGGMTPSGVQSGEPYGSRKCIKSCTNNEDCTDGKCVKYNIQGGDIVIGKMGCVWDQF